MAMLMIRLQRFGRKHEPVFRLVLTDSKNSPKSGKFLEILGNYDTRKGDEIQFDTEKIKAFMSKGARLSDTVHNLLVEKKVIEGKKINKLPKKSPIAKEGKDEPAPAAAPASEPAKEEVKAEEAVAEEAKPETKPEEVKPEEPEQKEEKTEGAVA